MSLLLLPGGGGDGTQASMLQQIAILTPDVDGFADRVERTVVGASVRVVVDGTSSSSSNAATKVAVVTDPEVRARMQARTCHTSIRIWLDVHCAHSHPFT